MILVIHWTLCTMSVQQFCKKLRMVQVHCTFVNLQGSQALFWKFSQMLKSSVNLCTRPDRRCLPLASHSVIKVNCSSAKEATKSQSYVSQGGRGATINQIGFCTNQNLHSVCVFRLYVPQNHITCIKYDVEKDSLFLG